MTSASPPAARWRSRNSSPPMTGIRRSQSTMSTPPSAIRASASAPLAAVTVSCPSPSRMSESVCRSEGSSSTIRTRIARLSSAGGRPDAGERRRQRDAWRYRDRPDREEDDERGAALARAAHPDRSAQAVHQARHDREPEPDPLPRLLGREERLEDAFAVLVRHAGAGVGY